MFSFRPGRSKDSGKNGDANAQSHGAPRAPGTSPFGAAPNGNGHSAPRPVESVIGPGLHYTGALSGNSGLRIEGSFDGTIQIGGALIIAEGARVTAESIQAGVVSVAGTVKGNIVADKVEILSTGRIYGDLKTGSFASEEGAFLRGQITMRDGTEPEEDVDEEPTPKLKDRDA
jgi:cytoskeletal protein CcmA (bactofilin family)